MRNQVYELVLYRVTLAWLKAFLAFTGAKTLTEVERRLKLNEDLLTALRGDNEAREKASRLLREQLLRFLGKRLKESYGVSDSFLEDITQDTLIIVLNKLDTFRGESSFFTWVCAIAVRVAMAEVRKKRWSDYSLDALLEVAGFDCVEHSEEISDRLASVEKLEAVKMSMMTVLTERQRVALLAELDGISTDEIARRFNTTRGAIYSLTFNARRALIKDLRNKGFETEAGH